MRNKKLLIDPEFKALIPPLPEEEYAALEQSIERHGCRDPLVVWEGILVDGHSRFEICNHIGKGFKTVPLLRVDTREGAMAWMLDNQLARRNVNDFQRSELALKKEALLAAVAAKKQKKGISQNEDLSTNLSKGSAMDTRRDLAKAAGVSEGTLAKVKKIKTSAIPELVEKVRSGEVKIDVAAQVAKLPKEEQATLVAAGKDAMKAAAKEVRQASKQKLSAAHEIARETEESITNPKSEITSPPKDDDELTRLRIENATLRSRVEELSTASNNTDIENQLVAAQAEVQRLTNVCQELSIRIAALEQENDVLAERRNVQDQTDHEPESAKATVENCPEVLVDQPENDSVVVDASSPVTLDGSAEPNTSITIGEHADIDAFDAQLALEGAC
jgi:transcriptional regulator with XRE-family HTH domain